VAFFGKSPLAHRSGKGAVLDEVLARPMFYPESEDGIMSSIEGYIDPDRDTIFLHMKSWTDSHSFAVKCREAEEYIDQKGILAFWSSKRYEQARAALVLFHLCHILVCCLPGHSFDLSYVHLFKSLDNLRNKLQPAISTLLRSMGEQVKVPRDWASQGRPASPRLLFLFLSAPLALRGDRGVRDERKDAKPHRHPPIKRLEYSLEDQIYRILRKARIITNVAANSLFAVPANQEFVYVETGGQGTAMDPEAATLNTLLSLLGGQDVDLIADNQGPYYHQHLTEERRPKRCFSNFLKHHINVGFERGFQDNISKHGGVNSGERLGPPLWEMPTLSDWIVVADKIYEFLTVELTSDQGHPHCEAMMTLRDDLETEIMFSELRCKKILPTAMAAYKEGLPQHYTQEYHQAKLLAAMSLYSMQARGPASEKLAEVLAAECLAYWQAGRQMCEELSLTGNHCTARRHTVPGTKEENSGKVLPSMPHSSGVQYIAACNCGKKQANREDPFTLVDANFNFYQGLELDCCKDLEHISFPEHSPVKTGGLKDIRLDAKEDKVEKIGKGEQARKTSSEMENHIETNTEEGERSDTPAQDDAAIILEVLEHLHIEPAGTGKSPSKVAMLLASRSQQDALPHMKTLNSASGSKPEFSSWSLVCMGSSHLYSHSSGLGQQPGFISSAKFLLPWEVPLSKATRPQLEAKWPSILENHAKRASLRSPDEPAEDKITVKVFIGFEYECPRGHRFMVSAPDRPMKSSSTMREAANKLVASDLPLYMACPCRLTKPPVAQLTRIHVVTPKAPVWITINPQVQPSPGGPVFITGWEAPHKLAINSYWVLRLPYVYWGEGGAHLPPTAPPTTENPSGSLLKGALHIDEDWSET